MIEALFGFDATFRRADAVEQSEELSFFHLTVSFILLFIGRQFQEIYINGNDLRQLVLQQLMQRHAVVLVDPAVIDVIVAFRA